MITQDEESGIGWTIPVLTEMEFDRFRRLILAKTGINLRETKRHLLVSRVAQRLRQLQIQSYSAYFEQVTSNPAEMETLINRITTNKTSFFREPHHFEFLVKQVIPELRRTGQSKLRIWSAACSSGEEPYSIAIAAREALELYPGWDVKILASDIDTEMLERARAGMYKAQELEEMPEPRQRANFLRGYGEFEGMVQVRPEVRALVEFRPINLMDTARWPPEGFSDAVFCRNVIIYFDQQTQQKIVEGLASRLKQGGYFFAGHSESLHGINDLLIPVGHTAYRLGKGAASK